LTAVELGRAFRVSLARRTIYDVLVHSGPILELILLAVIR